MTDSVHDFLNWSDKSLVNHTLDDHSLNEGTGLHCHEAGEEKVLLLLIVVDYNGHEEQAQTAEAEASEEPRHDPLVPPVDLVSYDSTHDYADEHRPGGNCLRKVLRSTETLAALEEELAGPRINEYQA